MDYNKSNYDIFHKYCTIAIDPNYAKQFEELVSN